MEKSLYDQVVDRLDEYKPSTVPYGMEAFIDLIAENYNGGIEQWVDHDRVSEAGEIQSFLAHLKTPEATELGRVLSNLEKADEALELFQSEEYGEDYESDDEMMEEALPGFYALNKFLDSETTLEALFKAVLETYRPAVTGANYPMPQPRSKPKVAPSKAPAKRASKQKDTRKSASQRMLERHKMAEAADDEQVGRAIANLHKACMVARREHGAFVKARSSVKNIDAHRRLVEDIQQIGAQLKKVK